MGVAVGVSEGVKGGLCDGVLDTDAVIEGEVPTDKEAVGDPDTVEDTETEEDTVGKDVGVGVCVASGVGVVVEDCVDERELDAEALGVTEGEAPEESVAVGLAEREDDRVFEDEGVILGV